MRRFQKTAVSLVSGLAVASSLTIGTELPASAAAGCNTTFQRYSTIQRGSTGSQTKAAQCLLRSAGYQIRVDGSFSGADVWRVKAFQRSHRISQTGVVGTRTWTALLSQGSKPTLRYGNSGSSVRRLQQALTASGRPVPATGYFGPITRGAVQSLQRSQGWRATGTATTGVWRALQAGGNARISNARATVARPVYSTASTSSKGSRVVAFAKRQLGDRYVFGATGPNAWDCSGLTQGAWKSVGVRIPRVSQAQFRYGQRVSKSNLRPGDLVFFYSGISHVAIYAGNGNVIHASRPGKPVHYLKMKYMPYQGARRPA